MNSIAFVSSHKPERGLTAARGIAAIVAAWQRVRRICLEPARRETRPVPGRPRAGKSERDFVEQHLLDKHLGPEIRRILR